MSQSFEVKGGERIQLSGGGANAKGRLVLATLDAPALLKKHFKAMNGP